MAAIERRWQIFQRAKEWTTIAQSIERLWCGDDMSRLTRSIIWGLSFACLRFVIGAGFTLLYSGGGVINDRDQLLREIVQMAWIANVAGGFGAGLIAGFMRGHTTGAVQGLNIGTMSALGSYAAVGIAMAIYVGVSIIMEGQNGLGPAEGIAMTALIALFCGGFSAVATGAVVFPTLMIWGAILGGIQRQETKV